MHTTTDVTTPTTLATSTLADGAAPSPDGAVPRPAGGTASPAASGTPGPAVDAAPDSPSHPTPAELGVGARITLSVMSSDYVRVITGALAETSADGLTVETDPVSTRVAGPEQRIAEYLSDLVAAAARSGEHVSATVMLSRGCPGEVTCDLPADQPFPAAPPVALPPTGVHAVAQWALYPLADQPLAQGPDGVRQPDHMRDIYAAIEQARATGTVVGSDHYVTRLAGDVADILSTVVFAWVAVGRTVRHVTSHVTLSVNSPSAAASNPGATVASPRTTGTDEVAR